jgi:hypothetical protein
LNTIKPKTKQILGTYLVLMVTLFSGPLFSQVYDLPAGIQAHSSSSLDAYERRLRIGTNNYELVQNKTDYRKKNTYDEAFNLKSSYKKAPQNYRNTFSNVLGRIQKTYKKASIPEFKLSFSDRVRSFNKTRYWKNV